MSDVSPDPAVQTCAGNPVPWPVREPIEARTVRLGEGTDIRRLLPRMGRRMVGAVGGTARCDRDVEPRFEHHTDLPVVTDRALSATVLLGEFAGARSPCRVHSPLAGVDLMLGRGADVLVPLEPE